MTGLPCRIGLRFQDIAVGGRPLVQESRSCPYTTKYSSPRCPFKVDCRWSVVRQALHLVLGNEGDHAVGASTITLQRLCLIHSLDELGPAFSESNTLFWRELELVLGWGGLVGAEGLKGKACLFPVGPRFRRIGPKISHPMCSRLWDLSEDSSNELEYIEGLALRVGEQRVVVGAFALVE
jgi:hypothetical protein